MTDTLFESNYGTHGGALFLATPSISTFTDTHFFANYAQTAGGALFVSGTANLTGVLLMYNEYRSVASMLGGGAVFCFTCKLRLDGVVMDTNDAGTGSTSYGGGGLCIISGGHVASYDSVFTGNSAHSGGAIGAYDGTSSVTLTRTYATRNKALTAAGALYSLAPATIVDASLFSDNTAGLYAGAAYLPHYEGHALTVTASVFAFNTAQQSGGEHDVVCNPTVVPHVLTCCTVPPTTLGLPCRRC